MRDLAKKACAETKAANEALQMFKLLQVEQGRQLDRANAGSFLLHHISPPIMDVDILASWHNTWLEKLIMCRLHAKA